MAKLTEQDIIDINELYLLHGTYSAVSRELGFSPATVKKYVINDYKPAGSITIQKFDPNSLPEFDDTEFDNIEDFGDICVLSETEKVGIADLWKEMQL